MWKFQYDELCGLWQFAASWAIQYSVTLTNSFCFSYLQLYALQMLLHCKIW